MVACIVNDDIEAATAAQWHATDPSACVWVEASAGSGKTTVLTNRVLALLLNGVAPERLLCLTFTKIAAAEMANRIAERLARWSSMGEEDLPAELANLTGRWPDDKSLARARGLFARVIESESGMKILTIHSFCQSVLARFPLEAGLFPQFHVLDETSAAAELAQARRLTLIRARSGSDPALTAAMELVAAQTDSEGFADLLDGIVAERGRVRRLLADAGGLAGTVARLSEALQLAAGATPQTILQESWAQVQEHKRSWLDVAKALSAVNNQSCLKLADEIRTALDANTPVTGMFLLSNALLTQKGEARKIFAKGSPALVESWQERAAWIQQQQERRRSAVILTASCALLTLAKAVFQAYEQAKRSRAWLDFDDLILAARALLEREGGVSWVLYKLDGGIDHILLDEAQDTNPDQWAVIAALAREFFAGQGTADRQRSLFAVGDPKQSIFGFQRADPKAFLQMQAVFRRWVSDAGQMWREVSLDYSFRSVPAVLSAVDAVFTHPRAAQGVVAGTSALHHRPTRANQPGLVELWPVAQTVAEEEETPWSLPRHRQTVESADNRLARLIAAQIERWLKQGEKLEARQRPMQAGDILILVRKRTVFGAALVRALKQRGIPVAGQDRMRLTGQLAVMDLMALGHFLLQPDDDLTLASLLKSPLIGLNEQELLDLAAYRGEISLWRYLCQSAEKNSRIAAARDELRHWLQRVDLQPPYELFADVLTKGGRVRLLERLGEEAADPIDEFLSHCLIYERDHEPCLQGLLAWLDSNQADIKRESDAVGRDEVRIMTVHGAKGLQAPVVILPDTVAPQKPPQDKQAKLLWTAEGLGPFWWPRMADRDSFTKSLYDAYSEGQRQESRRLLYVAMTRAEDRLYIAGASTKGDYTPDCWYALAQEALRKLAQPVAFDFSALGFDDWQGEGLRLGEDGVGGVLAHPAPGENPPADAAPFDSNSAPPAWSQSLAPQEPRPFRPLAPSHPGEEPPSLSPLVALTASPYRRGRLIHRVLQHLGHADPQAWPAAIVTLLQRFVPECTAEETRRLTAELLGLLNDPQCAKLFEPGSRAEVPLTGLIGQRAVSGRIDRLAVSDKTVFAVDFKTNRRPPTLVCAIPKPYLSQMALYRALLQRIYPKHRIQTGLIWTDGPSLMWLPDAMLDHAIDLASLPGI